MATIKNWTSLVLLLFIAIAANAQPPCTASFTSAQTSGSTVVVFTNTSMYVDSSAVHTATWAFGDGTASNDPTHTTHHYASAGTYTVCLTTAQANTSCSSSTCQAVVVTAAPACNMSLVATPTISGNTVIFQNTVTGGTAPYVYTWHRGDATTGTMTTSLNPVSADHTYAAGHYYSCFTVTDTHGCTATDCDSLTIGTTTACGFATHVIDTLNGAISVSFGSNNPVQGIPAGSYWSIAGVHHTMNAAGTLSYPFNGPGTYEICAVIPAGVPCAGTYCVNVVIPPPANACNLLASFTIVADSANANTYHFINTSTGNYTHASWYFADGTGVFHNLHDITHTFSGAGPFICHLEVSGNGCSNSTTVTIPGSPAPS